MFNRKRKLVADADNAWRNVHDRFQANDNEGLKAGENTLSDALCAIHDTVGFDYYDKHTKYHGPDNGYYLGIDLNNLENEE